MRMICAFNAPIGVAVFLSILGMLARQIKVCIAKIKRSNKSTTYLPFGVDAEQDKPMEFDRWIFRVFFISTPKR